MGVDSVMAMEADSIMDIGISVMDMGTSVMDTEADSVMDTEADSVMDMGTSVMDTEADSVMDTEANLAMDTEADSVMDIGTSVMGTSTISITFFNAPISDLTFNKSLFLKCFNWHFHKVLSIHSKRLFVIVTHTAKSPL